MKTVLFPKKAIPNPELSALKEELRTAQGELSLAYRQFDQAVDPELVESCIYQISAVKARCNYLLRAIKAHTEPGQAAVPHKAAVRTCKTPDAVAAVSLEDAAWT